MVEIASVNASRPWWMRAARGGALVLRGQPGIGKSSSRSPAQILCWTGRRLSSWTPPKQQHADTGHSAAPRPAMFRRHNVVNQTTPRSTKDTLYRRLGAPTLSPDCRAAGSFCGAFNLMSRDTVCRPADRPERHRERPPAQRATTQIRRFERTLALAFGAGQNSWAPRGISGPSETATATVTTSDHCPVLAAGEIPATSCATATVTTSDHCPVSSTTRTSGSGPRAARAPPTSSRRLVDAVPGGRLLDGGLA